MRLFIYHELPCPCPPPTFPDSSGNPDIDRYLFMLDLTIIHDDM